MAFFERVLPSEGPYCVMVIDPAEPDKDRRVRHVDGIATPGDVEKVVQGLSTKPLNIYYAVGNYEGKRRSGPIAKRALYLDLDSKDFGSKAEAVKELTRFVKALSMPMASILVDSGRGIHAYWCFDRDLPAADWKLLAGMLKKRCTDLGLKADPTVTSDAMRVLRAPGTLNRKDATPIPCVVLKDWGTTYDPILLSAALAPQRSGAAALLAGTVGADDLSTKGTSADFKQVPYYASEIITKCGVLKEAYDTGGAAHSEPLWSNILSLLAFTEDAPEFVHEVSNQHPGYDKEKTEAKFQYKLGKRANGQLKPVLCATFASYRPQTCAGCPFAGKINTPIVLGKMAGGVTMPGNYRVTQDGVYKLAKKSGEGEKDAPDEWKLIFPLHIGEEELIDTGEGEETFRAKFTSKNAVRTVELPATIFAKEGRDVFVELIKQKVHPGNFHPDEFKGFMMSWIRRMADIKSSTESKVTSMGWGQRSKETVFATGKKIFFPGGREEGFTHRETALLDIYTPKGKIEPWLKAADYIVQTKRQAATATLLSSFMAPLMTFTGQSGVTFSVYSVASGTGKSSIFKVAQAVWGHPKTGINSLNDTANSVTKKLGFLGNIPLYWDELRGDRKIIEQVVYQVIFGLGQGSEKKRLDSSARMQRSGFWDTLVTTASNIRITDHIDQFIKDTNAGRARVFEVEMPPVPSGGIASTEFDWGLKTLETNFGHAGEIYGKYLATHVDTIKELVRQNQQQLADELKAEPMERFWLAFIAAALSAAQLVNNLGLFTVDENDFHDWLVTQFHRQRAACSKQHAPLSVSAFDQLFRFVDQHVANVMVTDRLPRKGKVHVIQVQPRDKEILILKAIADSRMRIKLSAFQSWLYASSGVSTSTIVHQLLRSGAVQEIRGVIDGDLAVGSNTKVALLEIDLSHAAVVNRIGEQA